ncbi:MAG TPA: serine hydrolase domain-containing protein, partial [Flavobacterium sp.]|nr:serine hydrolase domain-containing protein [Flavobacterium sp.]
TGQKFDDFTEQYIMQPLKMQNTGWGLNSIDMKKHSQLYINKKTAYPFYKCVTYPDGSIITSSNDMSKYICELLKGYCGNGNILNKASYKEFFTQQLKPENFIERDTSEYGDYNIGIFMSFGPTGNFGHFGGDPGLFSVIYFDKVKKIGKYYITNTDADGKESGKYHGQIVNLLDEYAEKLDKLSKPGK